MSRNFIEIRETPSQNCGFRVANRISGNFIEKWVKRRFAFVGYAVFCSGTHRGRYSALVCWGTSRHWCFAQFHREVREMSSPNCGFRVVNGIPRNSTVIYGKRCLQTVGFASPMVFRAISLGWKKCRSGLRILRCKWYFAQVRREMRETPFPDCGFYVGDGIHMTSLRSTKNAVSKLRIPRCQ